MRGLSPTPPQARAWLTQELAGANYQSPWLDSAGRWMAEQLNNLLSGARRLTGLSPLITVLIALVVMALLTWVLPKVGRQRLAPGSSDGVLEDKTVTAGHYRDLAARACADRRYDDAVLDGFRAIAKDMSDRTLLEDTPGRTAHEISMALAAPFAAHAERLAGAADLFDAVRYGHRHASAGQARQIQALDAELATTGPLLATSLLEGMRG